MGAGPAPQLSPPARQIAGRRIIYLDSAATSQKPDAVIDAISAYYRSQNANIHRSVYTLAEEATGLFEGARSRIARFVGGTPDTTIFTRNATEAINLVAYAWGRQNVRVPAPFRLQVVAIGRDPASSSVSAISAMRTVVDHIAASTLP